MTAFVINLDHRTDRWQDMQKEWSRIFTLQRISAVKSKKKYLGCAQSHINAIRLAFSLYPQQSYCIVLEDDVKPLKSREYFEQLMKKLSTLEGLDCVSLNSTFDRTVTNETFLTVPSLDFLVINSESYLMSGTSFMIYSRRVLGILDEYQRHLDTSSIKIPNDRLFSTSKYGIYTYSPLICAVPQEMVCDLSELASVSDNFGGGEYKNHKENLDKLIQNSFPPIYSTVSPRNALHIRIRPFYAALYIGLLIGLSCSVVYFLYIVMIYFNFTSRNSEQGSLI